MFRTKDSEQLVHRATLNRSQRSLSSPESDAVSNSAEMVQRDTGSNWPYVIAAPTVAATPETSAPQETEKVSHKLRAMLQRVYERLSESEWERQRREREEYLAGSVDLYDLEDRMRRYDRFLSQRGERVL